MNLTFVDHQGKGTRLAEALTDAGHDLSGGDVLLIDYDLALEPYRTLCDRHRRVLLYPHGGDIDWGAWPTHRNTVVKFVAGTGHAECLAAAGYPRPVEVIGWSFCDRLPFRATSGRRVLLAPQHPSHDGWMPPGTAELNRKIHDELAAMDVELTVRWVGHHPLAHLGVDRQPHVTYRHGGMMVGDGVAQIDAADVVVGAAWTFPSLAVARGCPTVMYGQVRPQLHANGDPTERPSPVWVPELCRFPLDADDGLAEVLARACADESTVAGWRGRFVGGFDPSRFVALVERYGGSCDD